MKRGDPWYKRYSRDIFDGTRSLSLEERGAYNDILDLIYMHGGPIANDARWMSHALHVSVRKWEAIRDALVNAGKITIEDCMICNARARAELDSKLAQARANADTAASRERKKRENVEKLNENSKTPARTEHLTYARQTQTQSQKQIEGRSFVPLEQDAASGRTPAYSDLKSAFNGSTEAMIEFVAACVAGSRPHAERWLASTLAAHGQSAVAQAFAIVIENQAKGAIGASPLAHWSKTAASIKSQAKAAPQISTWAAANDAKEAAFREGLKLYQ